MPRRQGAWAMVLGLMTAIYTLALLLSLDFLPAGIAILVFYLFPIFTGIIVAIMGWTPFDRKTSIAALVALLGLGLALGLRLDDYNSTGLALAVVAALGLAVVSAFSARVIAASDPLRVTVYMSVGALVCLAVTVSAMDEFRLPTTESGWVGFILSHVFFAIGVIAYFVAIDKVGPSISATLSNLQPLIVIAIAFLILGQSLAPLQLVGAIIVVGALIAAAREGPKVRQSMSAVPPEGDETG